MTRGANQHDERQACCGPSPQSGGSCCGDAGELTAAPRRQTGCCGAPPASTAEYPYGAAEYVTGTVETPVGAVPQVSRTLVRGDRAGARRVRWGFGRDDYRVRPGVYAAGTPDAGAPVLVTANYKLTFDALRSSLEGIDAWLLVVDTQGINVWCAAGKGTFCAEEIARVVRETRLGEIVDHRRLILPQLSAPGVAAHRVKQACGFRATFGPIRSKDLPAFLAAGMHADSTMREVTFDALERARLVPEELSVAWDRRLLLAYAGVLAVSAIGRDGVSLNRGVRLGAPVIGAAWLALLAGGAATPLALPWLPGRAFSVKGALAGGVAAAGAARLFRRRLSRADRLALLAAVPAIASYAAMNFTGATPITSPSGVEREMRRALPLQAAAGALAVGAWLTGRMGR
jgi:hypothetical protein